MDPNEAMEQSHQHTLDTGHTDISVSMPGEARYVCHECDWKSDIWDRSLRGI